MQIEYQTRQIDSLIYRQIDRQKDNYKEIIRVEAEFKEFESRGINLRRCSNTK